MSRRRYVVGARRGAAPIKLKAPILCRHCGAEHEAAPGSARKLETATPGLYWKCSCGNMMFAREHEIEGRATS